MYNRYIMNIFILDIDPQKAAKALCNKHLSKMIIESAQMLYTAHWILNDGKQLNHENSLIAYKKTHHNHPCNVWIRNSLSNYMWLANHALAICKEYQKAYKKEHKSYKHIIWLKTNPPDNLLEYGLTYFAMAFYKTDPKKFKLCFVPKDPILSYRKYYVMDKKRFAKWTHGRNKPDWWDKIS